MDGHLALVLTAHVPYLRSPGRQPEGEDLLHETIGLSVVPTLNALSELHEAGLRPRAALAYSPLLIEQLADPVVQKHFVLWMESWLGRIEAALRLWEREERSHEAYLARFYLAWGEGIVQTFAGRWRRSPIGVLRELCAEGVLEPLGGAATHAYLPLLEREEAVRTQIDLGVLTVARRLGERPRGFWLPECGYHRRVDALLQAAGIDFLLLDPSSVPIGASPLQPYAVAGRGLTALVRHAEIAEHVWSHDLGYPGDPLYRAARREPLAGLALERNGGAPGEPYDPYHAFRRAQEHAAHFRDVAAATLRSFQERHDRSGVVVVPLDASLIGVSWFEGPAWLRALFESEAGSGALTPTTPGAYLRAVRPRARISLRDGSWGDGGDHRAWGGGRSYPLWQAIAEVEEQVIELASRHPGAAGPQERAIAQALRELLLAQSSDWPLQLEQGAADEALSRPLAHLRRCEQLCALADSLDDEASEEQLALLAALEELDNPFPDLNYRLVIGS